MDPTKSTSRYILTALAIIIVITAFVLVGLNAYNLQGRLAPSAGSSYKDGFLAARAMYSKLYPNISGERLSFTGTVQSVSGGSLKVLQTSLDTDPRVDGVPDLRTVNVTGGTEISKVVQKSPEQFQKEMAAFAAARSASPAAPPPSPVLYEKISLSSIKANQRVSVSSDSDIRLAETITAKRILVSE